MPLSKLVFKPGINRDQTNYASEGGWYECDKVRFRSGYPEKIGGWVVRSTNQYQGVCRSIFPYATSTLDPLLGIATNSKIYGAINAGGTTLFDITPLRAIKSVGSSGFSVTNGSKVVTVTVNANGAVDGDYVSISGATGPVGGIPASELNTNHKISNAQSNTFQITVTTAATSTTTGGGSSAVASFEIYAGFATQTAGYGWGSGAWGTSQPNGSSAAPIGWGLASTVPVYYPARLIFQDRYLDTLYFNIRDNTGNSLYSSAGTNIFYWQYDNTWTTRAVRLGASYAVTGASSPYTLTVTVPNSYIAGNTVNLSFLAASGVAPNDGNYTVATATGSSFTVSVSSASALSGTGSVEVAGLTSVPQKVGQIVFASTGHLLALSCTDIAGNYDPLLIRWSNVDPVSGPQPEIWYPTIINTAGDLRVSNGSRIITSYKTRQEILIFTDFAVNTLQFLGTSEIFGLQEIASDTSIIGPNTVYGANNTVFWMGVDKFYYYNGRVDTLPCTLRQLIFQDINQDLSSLFVAGGNAQFNEIIWFYASANSNTLNRYVIYNYQDQIWYYGSLDRTYWTDAGYVTNPLAAQDGWIYEHENGNDAGQPNEGTPLPIEAYIKSGDIDMNPDGDKFILLRKIVPDMNFTSSTSSTPEAYMTVGVRNFPGASQIYEDPLVPDTYNNVEGQPLERGITTASINNYTNQIFIRARGRQMNFTIGSDTLGTQWQLGIPRFDAREDGRRGGENP